MGLGHAASRAGEHTEAVKAYGLALALNPGNYIVRLALARVYGQLNQSEEAAREARQVLLAHPHYAAAEAEYGVTLVHLKRYDQALPALLKALELGDKTARTQCFLGNAYLPLGKSSEAVRAYEEAIRLDANYAPAYVNLAMIYVRAGQPDKARPYYQKGCRLDRELCRQVESKFR
jgi:tetratricopeptide (TPR) repeat protein